MHRYCRWLPWWRTNGSFYPHPWHGQVGSQADMKLILHCPKPSGHHTLLSLHVLLFLVFVWFYLMPCQWVWVMAGAIKLRKYIHVHNTAKLLQMKEYALSLNKWRNTPCHWTYQWEQIYTTWWFEFWHISDLTGGLSVFPILSYRTIQEDIFCKIYGLTPARSIDKMQSPMFVKGMTLGKLPTTRDALFFTAGALTIRFQSDDKSTCST